jgi:hypothetical protein
MNQPTTYRGKKRELRRGLPNIPDGACEGANQKRRPALTDAQSTNAAQVASEGAARALHDRKEGRPLLVATPVFSIRHRALASDANDLQHVAVSGHPIDRRASTNCAHDERHDSQEQ